MPPDGMMGDGAPPGGGAPPAPPQAGGGQPPPTGPGPATQPVANQGLEAAATARLAVFVQGMQTLLAALPAGSDIARDVRQAVDKLAKHVPPGGVSRGVQMTENQRMLMQQKQQPQIAAMRQGGGAPPAGGPPQMAA
jgi:hypothetical protein